MISPISIATRGRISKSVKKALTYSTLGLMVIMAQGIPVKPTVIKGSTTHSKKFVQNIEKNILYEKIIREDDEMLTMIKIFLQCQK
jgi:hypothetical protein